MSSSVRDSVLDTTANYLAQKLGLQHLPPHFHAIVLSAAGFQALEILSGPISARLFGKRYTSLRLSARRGWAERAVSLTHALIVVPYALHTKYRSPGSAVLAQDKAFGWDVDAGRLFSFSVGYFLWDTLHAIRQLADIGFIAHGAVCLSVYASGFRPFLAYYGASFLLWEASTPFVDFHWFFDKLGMTGSWPQLINGVLLLLTFFFVRIVYGGYLSLEFFETLQAIRGQISTPQYVAYVAGNLVLNFLNCLWFYKMIKALRKRFKTTPPSPGHNANGNGNGNGKLNGHAKR